VPAISLFARRERKKGWREARREKEKKEGRKEGRSARGKEGAHTAKGRKAGGKVITAGLCKRAGRGYACQLEGIQLSIA